MLIFYRTTVVVFIGLLLAVFVIPGPKVESADKFIKKANYFIRWDLTDSMVPQLAKWDLLIFDMEMQVNSADLIKKIRQLNPNVKIFAYLTSQEIRDDANTNLSQMRKKLVAGIPSQWYLQRTDGYKYVNWPGTHMLNVSDKCPVINGLRFNQYLASFVASEILSSGLWDGVFYDNTWENAHWFVGNNVDYDLNSQPEGSIAAIDGSWQNGMRQLFQETRRLAGSQYMLIGNAINKVYRDELNGIMLENFGDNHLSWSQNMEIYNYNEEGGATPKMIVINANTKNTGKQTDYKKMRLGLGSALMGDGYYSFDYGDQDHSQLWWYDEYNVNLGATTGGAVSQNNFSTFKEDVWRRDFANGIALVNPTSFYKNVDLAGEYEKIKGAQDPLTNDGAIVSSVTLPPQDGLVMLKSLQGTGESQVVNDLVFVNGDFLRFYDMKGNRVRNGFFVFDDDYAGGTKLFYGDLNGQAAKNEKITVEDNFRIKIYNDQDGLLYHDYPFNFNAGHKLNLAVGSLFGDPDKEVMFNSSGGGQIMVVGYYGLIMQPGFYPFGAKDKTGFSLAIGNVDGGDRGESVLGFVKGNKAEVLIYDFRFTSLKKRFTVGYDSRDARVAVGDVNGDGKDEIVVALNYSNKSVVKTFDFNGNKLAEFTLTAGFGGSTIDVGALDVNYDGKDDIVVMSK